MTDNLNNGIVRSICSGRLMEGQYENGQMHGYFRFIHNTGWVHECYYKHGERIGTEEM